MLTWWPVFADKSTIPIWKMQAARARGKGGIVRKHSSIAFDVDGGSGVGSKIYDGCCFCPLPVVPLKSKTSSNPDRWFLRCPLWKNTQRCCGYFQWLDEIEEQCVEGEVSSENSNMVGIADPKKKSRINQEGSDGRERDRMMMVLPVVNDMKEKLKRVEFLLIVICVLLGLNLYLSLLCMAKYGQI
ncbi:GRF zinc finger protein [Arachis hypogaea]|nr:GRF zinc finger protein [Arachis hypogaea]